MDEDDDGADEEGGSDDDGAAASSAEEELPFSSSRLKPATFAVAAPPSPALGVDDRPPPLPPLRTVAQLDASRGYHRALSATLAHRFCSISTNNAGSDLAREEPDRAEDSEGARRCDPDGAADPAAVADTTRAAFRSSKESCVPTDAPPERAVGAAANGGGGGCGPGPLLRRVVRVGELPFGGDVGGSCDPFRGEDRLIIFFLLSFPIDAERGSLSR